MNFINSVTHYSKFRSKSSSKFSLRSLLILIVVFFSAYSLAISAGLFSYCALRFYLVTLFLGYGIVFLWKRLSSKSFNFHWGQFLVLAVFWVHLFYEPKRLRILYPTDPKNLELLSDFISFLPIIGLILFLLLWRRVPQVLRWASVFIIFGLLLYSLCQVILISPQPEIDVWHFLKESITALLSGNNPYSIDYTNIYGDTPWYPSGRADSYPYPPMSLVFNLFYPLTGDPRWGLLLCHTSASIIIFLTARRANLNLLEAFAIGGMGFSAPFNHFLIEQSWTEPSLVFVLSLFSYFVFLKKEKAALVMAGLGLSLKQTMIVFIPFIFSYWSLWSFWKKRNFRKIFWFLSLSFLSYGLFFIWSPLDLWNDLVVFHSKSPFRKDGLTLLSWINTFHPIKSPPSWSSFLGMFIGVSIGSYFLTKKIKSKDLFNPLRMSFFWFSFGLTYLLTLLLSKQAFTNYFYLVHFLLVLALLWSRLSDEMA